MFERIDKVTDFTPGIRESARLVRKPIDSEWSASVARSTQLGELQCFVFGVVEDSRNAASCFS